MECVNITAKMLHRSIGDDLFDKFMKNNEINSGIQLINSSFRWRNECGFASCFFFVQTVPKFE